MGSLALAGSAAELLPRHEVALQEFAPDSLAWAHPVVQEWFTTRFGTPTEPQIAGWPVILAGEPTLISAPTGSGKTLAAFLVCIDQLLRQAIDGRLAPATQVVYISPLKALSNDVQKNLDGPLREIQQLALERGYLCPEIRTGVRTGDTLAKDRAAMLRHPPHILVTTPESLYILLTAGKSRENVRSVRTLIVDEIHAIADDKRGAHLALTLERLDALVCGENRLAPGSMLVGRSQPPQRIGLSATQNPIELVAEFLTGACEGGGAGNREQDIAGNKEQGTYEAVQRTEPGHMRRPATIVQVGQRRTLDLAIEVPSDELGSLTSTGMWTEIYDKLAAHALAHRSTLVFVNTRRLVEKISFELAERLGLEAVAAHHGSLSRTLRLDAEQRLKNGEIRILVATASLELGIDIGNVDLVCQIATTRAVAVAMQRVGRAGHWRGAVPKGRLFATTRDDLMEQAALIRKMRAGELDRLEIPPAPADVLMQQIVACCGAESWDEDCLYRVLRRAYPYRTLTREHFDELVGLLHEGIESSRGRYGAYLLRDRVQGQLHGRRGARMIAISNGGAIPDTSIFAVILQPEGVQIATLDEHFAVDSSAGDVVLLGNASWRIQKIDPLGKVFVEDAHGAPPTIPFWEGEAPQRTAVLSDGVADLRAEIDRRTANVSPSACRKENTDVDECIAWLCAGCGVCSSAAMQLVQYIVAGRAVLGAVPTKQTIIAERFFDEGGGMQLILHAPFGGRINKAWGLALRKRFCRGFNFELQASATDNGINISLAEQHSFPLADVFQFLSVQTARDLLEQASITSPLFKNRWRWAAGRSLQLLRMQKGKRVAPQVQRTRSDDLLASVFPQAAACFETIVGDIQIPDHPLVREVMQDTLGEAMDLPGLLDVLEGIASGAIRCLAVDTPVPSQFAHELVNAMPYSFLDEADAAARRARAVTLRRQLPDGTGEQAGRLDQAAIDTVRHELWPDLRDEHELCDLLQQLVVMPHSFLDEGDSRHWPLFFERLNQTGRAREVECTGERFWIATERTDDADALWSEPSDLQTAAVARAVRGWLALLGPTTAAALAERLRVLAAPIVQALLAMEMQGLAMRGIFEHSAPDGVASTLDDTHIEWCERRILQRIHRLTLATLRKQVEAVSPAIFMRWLLGWQHLAPQTQMSGEEGVLAALEQMEGFEAPASEWERTLLPARVANYDPRWLDQLCLAGVVGWGRVSPHPAWSAGDGAAPRRVIPTNAAPITFYLRDGAHGGAEWLPAALAAQAVDEAKLAQALSADALRVRTYLGERGASFAADIQRILDLSKQQTQQSLWELAAAGLAAADGFDPLRAMMDPKRKAASRAGMNGSVTGVTGTSVSGSSPDPFSADVVPAAPLSLKRRLAARTTAGRWSLLSEHAGGELRMLSSVAAASSHAAARAANASLGRTAPSRETLAQARGHQSGHEHAGSDQARRDHGQLDRTRIEQARRGDAALESFAHMVLCRYGVVFRDLLVRESNVAKWRDLVGMLRRLEARGVVRGGRFVTGVGGEQFALPEAVESLRASRSSRQAEDDDAIVTVAAADPMNLVGVLVPGERVAAIPGRTVQFWKGAAVGAPDMQSAASPDEDATSSPAALTQTNKQRGSRPPSPVANMPALDYIASSRKQQSQAQLPSLFPA
jgi:ATP-dependent Lhr-like helicase